ncbi:MAG: hypothetical protein LBQ39_08185 [Tannerellaceae bacterium]|jgi:hypothetical protein|nr:hypothetical protein [Tannerellaceae bacterium]
MKEIVNFSVITLSILISGLFLNSCDEGKIFSQPESSPRLETTALESYTVTATSPREVRFSINSTTPWTIQSSEPWCEVTPVFSSVSSLIADITVVVERNEATTPRMATLTITAEKVESQTVTINQDSKGNLEVEMIDETDSFGSQGGSKLFTVVSNRDWTISSSSTWLSISPKSGSASENQAISITATAAPNKATKRTATITVRNGLDEKAFHVVQDGILFSLTNTEDTNFSGATEIKEYELTANIPWEAEIVSGKDWLTVSPASGSSSANIVVSAANNTTLLTRTGQVIIRPAEAEGIEPFVLDFFQDNMQDGTTRLDFRDGHGHGIYAPPSITFSSNGATIRMTNADAENGGGWARIRFEDYSHYKLGIFTWKFSAFNFPTNSATWFDINAWESDAGNYHLFLNTNGQYYISSSFGAYDEAVFSDFDLSLLESITIKVDHDPENSGKLRLEVFFNNQKVTQISNLNNLYAENPNQNGPCFYYGLMYENYAGAEAEASVTLAYFQKTPLN